MSNDTGYKPNLRTPAAGTAVTEAIQADLMPEIYTFNKYRLKVIDGPEKGKEIIADKRSFVIGSSYDCDLVLDDSTVSRRHCRIVYDRGGYLLEDLDSKNGTYLESFKIKKAYLRPGVKIGLGCTTIQFELEGTQINVYVSRADHFGELYGKSIEMKEIFGILQKVSPTDATVLITGESGTGKDLAARAIHQHSRRSKGPFVVFDCSSVPRELIESELFGHVKGAFTGAIQDRPGAFVSANGGTLFLDEIGELPLELQPKLLRAIESKEIKPIGTNQVRKIDVRIIAATNRHLEQMVKEGTFRADLYYRLAVIRVHMPPLSQRKEDIPFLVELFLKRLGKLGEGFVISHRTMEKLMEYNWPGNVRELKNYVERAAILSQGRELDPSFLHSNTYRKSDEEGEESSSIPEVDLSVPFKLAKERLIERFEKAYLTEALKLYNWNITQAAQKIGIHRKSLEYLIKKHNLRRS